MGIMYKLMKHKHNLDLMEPVQDKQMTAEHILQLCKFLAEKSKRNKQMQIKIQQPRKHVDNLAIKAQELTETEMVLHKKLTTLPSIKQNQLGVETTTSLTLTTNTKSTKQVLAAKLSNATSSQHNATVTTSPSLPTPPTATCSMQFQQHGGKKDILQKIRNQILERKRQRQMACMQRLSGVWRPW